MKFFKKQKNSGFTLVELIVVIAILAILAAVAYPVYTGYIKKAHEAADQVLIGAINDAFAAACEERGVNRMELGTGGAKLDGDGSITGIASVTGLTDDGSLNAFKTAFNRYFQGNTGTELQYYKVADIAFSGKTHTFVGGDQDAVAAAKAIEAWRDSGYAGHAKETATGLKIIDELFSNFFGNKHKKDDGTFYDQSIKGNMEYIRDMFYSGQDVDELMKQFGITADDSDEEASLKIMKYVAKNTSGKTLEEIQNSKDPMVQYPLQFAWSMGYRNSKYCTDEFAKEFDGMLEKAQNGDIGVKSFATFAMENMLNPKSPYYESFTSYMADSEQFQADNNGYIGAMTMMDQNQELLEGGMTVEEMTKLIEQIMSGK